MLKVSIAGASGRVSRALIERIYKNSSIELIAATVRDTNDLLGKDVGVSLDNNYLGVSYSSNLEESLADCNVVIDFTRPDYTLSNLKLCSKKSIPMVIGTTGFTEEQMKEIKRMSSDLPVVLSSNTSVGVNLLLKLIAMASKALPQADIEIVEAHHRHKKDAPSGTALTMGKTIAETLNRNLDDCACYSRSGLADDIRDCETIGFSTIRAGSIIGEHTAIFALNGERVEISHKAENRFIFADGALKAAYWLVSKNRSNGLYSMQDVLGIKT